MPSLPSRTETATYLRGPRPAPPRGSLPRLRFHVAQSGWARLGADAAYIFLAASGWLAGNLLGVLGCAVAMFIVISHGQPDVFFLHVDNLAARYVAADLGRRAAFEHQLVQVFTIVLTATLAIRGPRFIARLRRDLRDGRQA